MQIISKGYSEIKWLNVGHSWIRATSKHMLFSHIKKIGQNVLQTPLGVTSKAILCAALLNKLVEIKAVSLRVSLTKYLRVVLEFKIIRITQFRNSKQYKRIYHSHSSYDFIGGHNSSCFKMCKES